MPPRTRSGFTLVELLIVMVVIGVLAAIAIPKYTRAREKSYIAAVTSDLKNLATLQEIYQSNNQTYAADTTDLKDYHGSEGVVLTITEATLTGWAATGYHAALSGRTCGIFLGAASSANAPPATLPGTVACDK